MRNIIGDEYLSSLVMIRRKEFCCRGLLRYLAKKQSLEERYILLESACPMHNSTLKVVRGVGTRSDRSNTMRGTSLPSKSISPDRTTHLVLITLMAACCLATMLMGSNHLRRTERARVSPGVFTSWESDEYMKTHRREDMRSKLELLSEDFALVVIANACDYDGVWKEHALVLKAAARLVSADTFGPVRVFVLGYGNSSSPYRYALQVMAQHIGLPSGVVQHVGVDEDINGLLWASDAVLFTSGTEEHGFPPILVRSLTFERPVIVPDISPMNKHISDGHNGFIFPPGDDEDLGHILWVIKNNPSRTSDIAAEGKLMADILYSRDAVLENGHILESLLDFPEACILPRPIEKIPGLLPRGWNWDILAEFPEAEENSTVKDLFFLKSETDLKPIENEFDTMDIDRSYVEEWDLLEDEEQRGAALD